MGHIKVVACLLLFLSCRAQNVKIIPLSGISDVDTLRHDGVISTYRTDYYLVRGKSKDIKKLIWLYALKNLDSSLLKFNQYDMKFYKETKTFNLKILPKYKQKYKAFMDEQPIVSYSWFNGHLISY